MRASLFVFLFFFALVVAAANTDQGPAGAPGCIGPNVCTPLRRPPVTFKDVVNGVAAFVVLVILSPLWMPIMFVKIMREGLPAGRPDAIILLLLVVHVLSNRK